MVDARHFAQGTSADPTPMWQSLALAHDICESELQRLHQRASMPKYPTKSGPIMLASCSSRNRRKSYFVVGFDVVGVGLHPNITLLP